MESKNGVIYKVYIYNGCDCGFGASYERCVHYACKYTEQIKITGHIKDTRKAIFTGSMLYGKR